MSQAFPANTLLSRNTIGVHTWPNWRGTPLDLILYAGYLWGRGIINSPPWIVWTDSVRLGATNTLCLTIDNVNGLVLTMNGEDRRTDRRNELIDKVVSTITTLLHDEATISFNDLDTDHTFIRNSERKLYELRYVCNNSILTPTHEE